MTLAETAHGFGSGPEPDPRTLFEPTAEQNVLPVVQRPRKGLSSPVVAGFAVLAGLGLFGVLEARRQTATAPAIAPTTGATSANVATPPLYPAAPAALAICQHAVVWFSRTTGSGAAPAYSNQCAVYAPYCNAA